MPLPLITDWPNRPRQMVDFTQGKPSQTLWRLLHQPLFRLPSRLRQKQNSN